MPNTSAAHDIWPVRMETSFPFFGAYMNILVHKYNLSDTLKLFIYGNKVFGFVILNITFIVKLLMHTDYSWCSFFLLAGMYLLCRFLHLVSNFLYFLDQRYYIVRDSTVQFIKVNGVLQMCTLKCDLCYTICI